MSIASQLNKAFTKDGETIKFVKNCGGDDVEFIAQYQSEDMNAIEEYSVIRCNGATEGTPYPDDLSFAWDDGMAVIFEYQEDGTMHERWDDSDPQDGNYLVWNAAQ